MLYQMGIQIYGRLKVVIGWGRKACGDAGGKQREGEPKGAGGCLSDMANASF